MIFTEAERRYLTTHPLGRLATVGPRGAPHVHPVALWVDLDAGTIDIGGPALSRSQKFRNVQADPRISLIVDDQATPEESVGPGGQTGRGLEIRGSVEILVAGEPPMTGFGNDVLRVHPHKIISWNVDGPGYTTRTVSAAAAETGRRRWSWPPVTDGEPV
ncbi:PPOX class F420-dependent oxidoreductase [Pseudofrankia saprophytica]|uniref:PPOX class F420-dependent oxidoreductase n=1 Tax=Pseudofrankia saprophytica TaxID=298655 RepID=UPI000234B4FF|nr:PPOX class F420-dependent oxidoreductase [Pseudofrankia saprophytica]